MVQSTCSEIMLFSGPQSNQGRGIFTRETSFLGETNFWQKTGNSCFPLAVSDGKWKHFPGLQFSYMFCQSVIAKPSILFRLDEPPYLLWLMEYNCIQPLFWFLCVCVFSCSRLTHVLKQSTQFNMPLHSLLHYSHVPRTGPLKFQLPAC